MFGNMAESYGIVLFIVPSLSVAVLGTMPDWAWALDDARTPTKKTKAMAQ